MHTHSHPSNAPAQTEGRLIRWATFYDSFTNLLTFGHIRRLRMLTVALAELKPGEKILDVGCGTGGVTLPAKNRVGARGHSAGLDPAPEMIAVAKKKAARAGLEIDFRLGVIEALPYPDHTFDVVTSSLMMHHLPEHLQAKGLAEIKRVLKPGGRLLIADIMRPDKSLHAQLFAFLTLHYGHGMKFGLQDLPQMLGEMGFEGQLLNERFLTIGFVRAIKN